MYDVDALLKPLYVESATGELENKACLTPTSHDIVGFYSRKNIIEAGRFVSDLVQLQLVGATHNNQRLFSDHYLNAILPSHWGSLKIEATQIMAQLRQIYARFTPNTTNEAQTEDDWIKPVLRALCHTFVCFVE